MSELRSSTLNYLIEWKIKKEDQLAFYGATVGKVFGHLVARYDFLQQL